MKRTLLSKAELAQILTARIQKHPRGRKWSVTPDEIFRIRRPTEDGRNWLLGLVAAQCWSAVVNVFSTAQYEFNLVDE